MMKWKVVKNPRSSSADRSLECLKNDVQNNINNNNCNNNNNTNGSNDTNNNVGEEGKPDHCPPVKETNRQRESSLVRKPSAAATECINLKSILGLTRQRSETNLSQLGLIGSEPRRSRSEVRGVSCDRLTVGYHTAPGNKPFENGKTRSSSPPSRTGWLRGRKREREFRNPVKNNQDVFGKTIVTGSHRKRTNSKSRNGDCRTIVDGPDGKNKGKSPLEPRKCKGGSSRKSSEEDIIEEEIYTEINTTDNNVRGKLLDENRDIVFKDPNKVIRKKGMAPKPQIATVLFKDANGDVNLNPNGTKLDDKSISLNEVQNTPPHKLPRKNQTFNGRNQDRRPENRMMQTVKLNNLKNSEMSIMKTKNNINAQAIVAVAEIHKESVFAPGHNSNIKNKNVVSDQESSKSSVVNSSEKLLLNRESSVTNKEYSVPNRESSATHKEYSVPNRESSATHKEYSVPNRESSATHKEYSVPNRESSATNKEYSVPKGESSPLKKESSFPIKDSSPKKESPLTKRGILQDLNDRIDKKEKEEEQLPFHIDTPDYSTLDSVNCNSFNLSTEDIAFCKEDIVNCNTDCDESFQDLSPLIQSSDSTKVTREISLSSILRDSSNDNKDSEPKKTVRFEKLDLIEKYKKNKTENLIDAEDEASIAVSETKALAEKLLDVNSNEIPPSLDTQSLLEEQLQCPENKTKLNCMNGMTVNVMVRNPSPAPEESQNDESSTQFVVKKSFVLTVAKQEKGFRSLYANKKPEVIPEPPKIEQQQQISVTFLCSGPPSEGWVLPSPEDHQRLRSTSVPPRSLQQMEVGSALPSMRGRSRERRSKERQHCKKNHKSRKKDAVFTMPQAVIDELSQVLEKRKPSLDEIPVHP